MDPLLTGASVVVVGLGNSCPLLAVAVIPKKTVTVAHIFMVYLAKFPSFYRVLIVTAEARNLINRNSMIDNENSTIFIYGVRITKITRARPHSEKQNLCTL